MKDSPLQSPHPPAAEDARWMRVAISLAARATGRTSPNPLVGAVLVKEGRVVGSGWHVRAGAAHAERVALEEAGAAARGATLYVTLEPCAHQGRTPPCASAVREAGVARVVSASEDPDPRVAGAGHRLLREAGIDVEVGVLETAARRQNEEYRHRTLSGRAFGVLKAAVTLDGRLAADGGLSRWISGEPARQRAHEFRNRYDVALIGRGTLDQDDPSLDVRRAHPEGGADRDPVAVVVDSQLRSGPLRKLWKRSKEGAKVIVATTDGARDTPRELAECGVEILRGPATEDGRVDLQALFKVLAERGWNSVLLEGGEAVHTAALRAQVVQRAHVFVAPLLLGGQDGPRLVGDLGIRDPQSALRLRDVRHEILGEDVLVTGRVHYEKREED